MLLQKFFPSKILEVVNIVMAKNAFPGSFPDPFQKSLSPHSTFQGIAA